MAINKSERYANVQALHDDIIRFLDNRQVSVKADSLWESAVKFYRRNRAASFVAMIGVIVFTAFSGPILS